MTIRQVDIEEKREQELEQEDDFYGEIGCCKTCTASDKENREGFQDNVWFNGKHYDCVCFDCKCTRCSWYYRGKCQREGVIL